MKEYLCFDIGASSGRAMIAQFDGSSVQMEELGRFRTSAVRSCTGYYWDVLSMITHIKDALADAKHKGYHISSLGIDCFGVDFGLLSASGELLGNPISDMDPRTSGILEHTSHIMSIDELYAQTGAQIYEMTTLFQLAALLREDSSALKQARHLLFMPDLLNYLLTGIKTTEFTVATTSLLVKPAEMKWNKSLMRKFGIEPSLFGDIELAGTSYPLCRAINDELLMPDIRVTTVAGHDTASAVIPIPAKDNASYAFVSSGTWSVIGVPTDAPVIDMRYAGTISNEGCFDGKNRLIKNVYGMMLLNKLKSCWHREGKDISFDQMNKAAYSAASFCSFIDPENLVFFSGDDMPNLIRNYCRITGQPSPETEGEFVRTVDESLAFCYKKTLVEMEDISGRKIYTLYIVGGGTQNTLLCQMAANACGIPIVTAAKESAALGNALMQLKASGKLKDYADMSACIAQSVTPVLYEPKDCELWQQKYALYLKAQACFNSSRE